SKRGSEHFNRISAVLISAYSYAFLSLYFFVNSSDFIFSPWFPLVWFFPLFIIGLILSLITLRKKWLFPAIFSHSLSNILMFIMIWCFSNGWGFVEILLVLYFPLIGMSLLLLLHQYDRIKDSILIGMKMLKQYESNNDKENNTKSNKYFRIFIDFLVGFLVFIVGLLIAI
ncbi:MAG: type II CAAX prenyl endopeptidase Rce1 family protein, partial [Promethearchaeota archaeon]